MNAGAPFVLEQLVEIFDRDGSAEARWFRTGVQRTIAGEVESLDEAFGLTRGRGERSWRAELAEQERNSHFRAARDRFGLRVADLVEKQDRYVASGWRFDSAEPLCPTRLHGAVEEHIWHAMKADPRPVKLRQMRTILRGNEIGVFIAEGAVDDDRDNDDKG